MGIIRQLTSRNGKIEPKIVKLAVRWALPKSVPQQKNQGFWHRQVEQLAVQELDIVRAYVLLSNSGKGRD